MPQNNRNYELGQKELQPFFDKVCSEKDWREPIGAFCRRSEMEMVRQAIIFFTATEPFFYDTTWEAWVGVTAIGYRNGPAGP